MYPTFPVHNSTPSGPALVERVLSKYSLPTPVKCNFFSRGLNDTYVVKGGSTPYYLRVYRHGWRTKAEIQAELDMLTYLHRQHLPVSWPLTRKDGLDLTRIAAPEGTRYAALFTNAPGKQGMNLKQCAAYGELVGQIHLCLDKISDDDRRFHLDLSHLIDEPLGHIGPLLEHRPKDFDYLKRVGHELQSMIDGLLPKTKPEYGNCHGDHHGGNVNLEKNGNMTLFDFDCYGYGWRAYDMAVFLWSRAFDWSRTGKAKRTRRWNALLEGYAKVRTLTTAELEATRVFVPIRHIWFLGLHTQGAETWGRSWINDGYFDRHLQFIRRWIEYSKIL